MDIKQVSGAQHLAAQNPRMFGIDFTSAPTVRKPIVVAVGTLSSGNCQLVVERIERLATFEKFDEFLNASGPWVGAFDLPFGLPREFVQSMGWPTQWAACIEHYSSFSRSELRDIFKAFCDARPVGQKFAHRATDRPAGSSPSMKWVNPPVAWMLHAGAIRLMQSGVHIPGLHDGDRQRVALEAYPGLLARSVTTASYKSDTRSKQTAQRQAQRELIVAAIESGECEPGVRTTLPSELRGELVADASGDALDAVLCLVQGAWAMSRADDCFGLPASIDPLEGWILGAAQTQSP